MVFRWSLCLPLMAVSFLSPLHAEEVTRKVAFDLRPGQKLEELEATGRWEILEVKGKHVVALEQVGGAPSRLQKSELESMIASQAFSVVSSNIDRELDQFRTQGNTGKYHTVASNEQELKAYAQQYPNLCQVESIGKTEEGRD